MVEQAPSSMKYRKATRYHELAKAREEVARLFPVAIETIEGILRHRKAPRALRLECAKLIYYQHLGRPPAMLEIDLEGEMVGVSQADKLAKASAEARRAFKDALDKAADLSSLDGFKVPEQVERMPEQVDQKESLPERAEGEA